MSRNSVFFYFLLIGSLFYQPLSAQLLPEFVDELIDDSLLKPVGIQFDNKGTGYVWEQSGLVHLLDTNGVIVNTPFIDIREEVSEFVDHGLLGFAIDPYFEQNHFVYLMYVVDPHHLFKFGTPEYDPNFTITNDASIGRITRYTADPSTNYTTVLPESRKVLIGQTHQDGFPVVASSHGVGTITFGTDGTLIASCGETGSFVSSDAGNHADSFFEKALEQEIIRPAENVGAYRAQLINSLGGKVIRIDKETGAGIPSNPYFDPNDPQAKRSKVWLWGLRNPFRIYLDQESGSHNPEDGNPGVIYIGDVGSNGWEELNVAPEGGLNFGWPVYEGMDIRGSFTNLIRDNLDAPNPAFDGITCEKEYFTFHEMILQPHATDAPVYYNPCDSTQLIPADYLPSIHERPTIAWLNHNSMSDSVAVVPSFNEEGKAISIEIERPEARVEGIHFEGSSSIAGFHYEGDNFPEEFQGRYFHADFDGWISVFDFDDNYNVIKVDTFSKEVKGVVDLKINPKDGCLYYVKAIEGTSVRRICYGGDPPPVAEAKADIYYGVSPLTVQLDASESYHPRNYPLTYEWILPDGSTSNDIQLEHVFTSSSTNSEAQTVELIVTDSVGNQDAVNFIISLNNTPPDVEITSFKDGDLYPLSGFTYLPLRARVTDTEHADDDLLYEWQAFLYHNTHNHAGPIANERESYALLEPVGCTDETYWYRVELRVTDPAGLSTKVVAEVFPNCDEPFGMDVQLSGLPKAEYNDLTFVHEDAMDIQAYEIQRSANNTDFIDIHSLVATAGADYTFQDRDPIWGINHYRIRVVKADGTYDYSNTITLDFPGERTYNIYPNPTDGAFYLQVEESAGSIEFELFDTSGKLLYTKSWSDDMGDGIEVPVFIRTLPDGVYYFQIDNGKARYGGSLIKR
jgi:glucose/arabinose dehydrogenase